MEIKSSDDLSTSKSSEIPNAFAQLAVHYILWLLQK